MRFYTPKGKEIESPEYFIEFYSQCYYLNNSSVVEDKIDQLLKNKVNADDLPLILAWKTGRINHRESNLKKQIVFSDSWTEDPAKLTKNRNGSYINVMELQEFMRNQEIPRNHITLLEELKKHSENSGLGTVYLLTLLYFLTNGQEPIYDRFAMIALTAIKKDIHPGDAVPYRELPDRSTNHFSDAILYKRKEEGSYIDYKQLLAEFPKYEPDNRDLDRALWVYGHLFSETNWKKYAKR